MKRLILRLITAIQLTRLTMAFGAVSDVWLVILLTRADSQYVFVDVYPTKMTLAAALAAGAIVAIGLFAYGASLNDVLDARHDSAFSPERPIPAGRIRLGQAMVVTVGALIIAMFGGALLGGIASVGMTCLTAMGLLFYNAAGKYIPAVGMTAVGIVHASHMLIPNYQLAFTLPVWLLMTHSMVIALLVHHLEDKRPRLRARALVATGLGWAVCTGLLLVASAMQGEGLWPNRADASGALWPLTAVMTFALVAWWKVRTAPRRTAGEKLRRYGAMWQTLYSAAWLLALDLPAQAGWIAALAVAGFLAMTLIKEVTGHSDRPVAYR